MATAEAAMATAQAAVEVARLTRPTANHARENYAASAVVIQTAFRGYLVSQRQIYMLISHCVKVYQ